MMKKNRFLIIGLIFVLGLMGCSKRTKGTESDSQTIKVFSQTFENTIEISGNINAADQQKMTAASDGIIEKVFFHEGDFVRKGDVICKMEDLEQQYNLASLKYQLAQKKLSASPRELELLEMQLKVKQQELDKKKCIARFDGIIAKLAVSEGDYLESSNEIATIIDRSYLKATVEVAETDASKLKLNQTVKFTFPAYSEPVTGYVSYFPAVGKITSRGSTVVEADVRIDNPPEEILTGFSFTGSIQITEPQTVVLVNKSALFYENKQPCVKKIGTGGTEQTVPIEYEPYGNTYIKIISGVDAGDELKVANPVPKSGGKKNVEAGKGQEGQSNSFGQGGQSKPSPNVGIPLIR